MGKVFQINENPAMQFLSIAKVPGPSHVDEVPMPEPLPLPAQSCKPVIDSVQVGEGTKQETKEGILTKHKAGIVTESGKESRELKAKRFNLLIQPSLFRDIEKIANIKEISVNEAFCIAAREYRELNLKDLELYRKVKTGMKEGL